MARIRLGVALLLPPSLSAEVDGLRRAVGDGALGRVPAHLTLVPPVNVAEARLADALAVLRHAAAVTGPITLELGPPGTFLPANPVLYLGVDGDVAGVQALRERVMREPLARITTWPFVPHVTLADSATPEVIEAAISAFGRYRAEARFDAVHLLREGPGRVWAPIAEARLRAPAVIGRGALPLELTVTSHLDPESAAFYRRQGHAEDSFAVTARRDGQVVGIATGVIRGQSARLDRLVVEVPRRRQGIGSHLLAAVESLAAERGCRAIAADGGLDGAAVAFLASRGWAQDAASTHLRRQLTREN
ncbi:MAG: GNAT family N-acetyltransferase [Actinomycetota bacterium]|nr:GNAT family N-acetyltransferase [Actinomycetota bacterium]